MRVRLSVLGWLLLPVSAFAQVEPPVTTEEKAPAPLVLSLDDAMRMAVENNLTLRAAIMDEEIQRAAIREALAAFDPTFVADYNKARRSSLFRAEFPGPPDPITGELTTISQNISQVSDLQDLSFGIQGILETGLSYDLTFASNITDTRRAANFDPSYSTSASLSITQPILRAAWASYNLAPVEFARIGRLEALEMYRITRRQKLAEVQQAYYDLVFANADIENKNTSVELAEEQIKITKQKVESGALAEIEITSAQAAKASRVADRVTAIASKREAGDRLRRLIFGFASDSDWEVPIRPSEAIELPDKVDEQLGADAVDLRPIPQIIKLAERSYPELLQAHMQVARAKIELSRRENERLPSLDLTAAATFRGLSDQNIINTHFEAFTPEDGSTNWRLGLGFEYPIGNRAAAARVAQARVALKQDNIALHEARTEMIFQIRNAVRNVEVARDSIAASSEARGLAQEQLANERLRLELRRSTNFQVFQVEEDLSVRSTALLQAHISYRLALLELVRTTGIPLTDLVKSL